MRIISSFKDYYDIGLTYGIDPKLVYVRETREFDILDRHANGITEQDRQARRLSDFVDAMPRDPMHHLTPGIISFCGVLYPCWQFMNHTVYDIDDLSLKLVTDKMYGHPLTGPQKTDLYKFIRGRHVRQPRYSFWGTNWHEWELKRLPRLDSSVHRFFGAPILAALGNPCKPMRFVVNPRLNTLNFASQVDPYTAFNELSMYIGNDLVVEKNPNPKIPDKLKAESAGFDDWSFRRHKDESKKNKKKR